MTEAEISEMRRLRAMGLTLQQIADRFGVHKSTVWRICR
jgi:transcriptional regulator with XRE-family HTH domain